jgi:hypothetical protein
MLGNAMKRIPQIGRRIKSLQSKKIRDLCITPPNPDHDRGGIAVVALIKDVGSHLEEWVKFHRRAGVSHFFV